MRRYAVPEVASAGQIQHPRMSQSLSKFFNIKGRSISPSLAPEIQPVVLVADLSEEVKAQGTATGVKWAMAGKAAQPTAGNFATFIFHNASTPGVIARVYDVYLSSNIDTEFNIGADIAVAAGASDPMDLRYRYSPPWGIEGGWFPSYRLNAVMAASHGSGEYGGIMCPAHHSVHINFGGRLIPAPLEKLGAGDASVFFEAWAASVTGNERYRCLMYWTEENPG